MIIVGYVDPRMGPVMRYADAETIATAISFLQQCGYIISDVFGRPLAALDGNDRPLA